MQVSEGSTPHNHRETDVFAFTFDFEWDGLIRLKVGSYKIREISWPTESNTISGNNPVTGV